MKLSTAIFKVLKEKRQIKTGRRTYWKFCPYPLFWVFIIPWGFICIKHFAVYEVCSQACSSLTSLEGRGYAGRIDKATQHTAEAGPISGSGLAQCPFPLTLRPLWAAALTEPPACALNLESGEQRGQWEAVDQTDYLSLGSNQLQRQSSPTYMFGTEIHTCAFIFKTNRDEVKKLSVLNMVF